ncbi:hypothetical protein Tco_0675018 [Tanacetum coccineum]
MPENRPLSDTAKAKKVRNMVESFIFVTYSLFPVSISKGIERRLSDRGGGGGGGGGGVVGSVGVVCGDGDDRGVGGVDCGFVCGFVCGVICGRFSWSHEAEGKDSFVKCNMTRNDDFVFVYCPTASISASYKGYRESIDVVVVVRGQVFEGGKGVGYKGMQNREE